MFLWCYFVVCWGDPGSLQKFYKKHQIYQEIQNGCIPTPLRSLPICSKCHLPKPERCHHCSVCQCCHFRFDHHCPIIGNCVCLYNFKAFILMPLYGFFLIQCMSLELSFHFKSFAIGLIIFIFSIALPCFSFSFCSFITSNKTTLESLMNPPGPSYDKGSKENFKEIYSNFLSMFIPTRPHVSGFHWCKNDLEAVLLKYLKDPAFREKYDNENAIQDQNENLIQNDFSRSEGSNHEQNTVSV